MNNSVGIIAKSHPKSTMVRMSINSYLADQWLSPDSPVVVLQVLVCGNGEMIVESVKKEYLSETDNKEEIEIKDESTNQSFWFNRSIWK